MTRSYHVNQNAKPNKQRRARDSLFFERAESTINPRLRAKAKEQLKALFDRSREDTVYRVWVLIALVGVVKAQESMSRSVWYEYLADFRACNLHWAEIPDLVRISQ